MSRVQKRSGTKSRAAAALREGKKFVTTWRGRPYGRSARRRNA